MATEVKLSKKDEELYEQYAGAFLLEKTALDPHSTSLAHVFFFALTLSTPVLSQTCTPS
jgi:hypothetical protein